MNLKIKKSCYLKKSWISLEDILLRDTVHILVQKGCTAWPRFFVNLKLWESQKQWNLVNKHFKGEGNETLPTGNRTVSVEGAQAVEI